jgi:NitT/TauT family transport system permease protein
VLVTLYALPKIALYPVVLLFFGIGFVAKVVFGAMYGFIPMMLIVINAIQSMNPVLPKNGAGDAPHEGPDAGNRRAAGHGAGDGHRDSRELFDHVSRRDDREMFGATRGLGYMLMRSININDTATIMGVTVLVALFAVTINAGLWRWTRRRITRDEPGVVRPAR